MAKKIYKAEPTMKPLGTRANKPVEKTAVTAKPKSSTTATTGKIKIGNAKVTTSGGPKPKTSVSGTGMASGTKVTKPAPKATAKAKPLTSSEKAFIEGQKKKAQITKKTGVYPNTAN
jgi:hypothetical protein